MIRMMSIIGVAWLIGLLTYEGWLRLAWHQSMGGDWPAVALWSSLSFVVAVPTVYAPAMRLLRAKLNGHRPIGWFPFVASLLGVVPTAMIVFLWGGGLRGLISPEASIFYVMFTAAGIMFGLGYAIKHDDTSVKGKEKAES